jgi:hypothetical protein
LMKSGCWPLLEEISMSVGWMPFEGQEASYVWLYVQVDVPCKEHLIDIGSFFLF